MNLGYFRFDGLNFLKLLDGDIDMFFAEDNTQKIFYSCPFQEKICILG